MTGHASFFGSGIFCNKIPVCGVISCQVSGFASGVLNCADLDFDITIDHDHKPFPHEKQDSGPQYVFNLRGGPTGLESFYISRNTLRMMFRVGWVACFGSMGYNRCFITGDELRRHLSPFLEG